MRLTQEICKSKTAPTEIAAALTGKKAPLLRSLVMQILNACQKIKFLIAFLLIISACTVRPDLRFSGIDNLDVPPDASITQRTSEDLQNEAYESLERAKADRACLDINPRLRGRDWEGARRFGNQLNSCENRSSSAFHAIQLLNVLIKRNPCNLALIADRAEAYEIVVESIDHYLHGLYWGASCAPGSNWDHRGNHVVDGANLLCQRQFRAHRNAEANAVATLSGHFSLFATSVGTYTPTHTSWWLYYPPLRSDIPNPERLRRLWERYGRSGTSLESFVTAFPEYEFVRQCVATQQAAQQATRAEAERQRAAREASERREREERELRRQHFRTF